MAINIGKPNICLEDITNRTSDIDILNYYFGIVTIPCVVKSPLRQDNRPSFGFYSIDGIKIYWVDYATKDKGGIIDLLGKYIDSDDKLGELRDEDGEIDRGYFKDKRYRLEIDIIKHICIGCEYYRKGLNCNNYKICRRAFEKGRLLGTS